MKNQFEELFTQAQMAFTTGRYDTSLDLCQRALELEPGASAVCTLAGNTYLVQEKFSCAEKYFLKAMELESNVGERYFDLGNSLFGQQRLSEALKQYAMAIQYGCSDEVMKKVYYIVGLINQLEGNSTDALINFDKSEGIAGANTDQVDMLLKKIQIYIEQNDLKNAENCAIQLRLLVPREFKSYQLLFQLYLEQNKISDAEKVLKEAVEYCPDSEEMNIEISFDWVMINCFLAEQEPQKMEEHYRKALEYLQRLDNDAQLSNKDKYEALVTRAEIYLKLNEYDEAIKIADLVEKQTSSELVEYIERARYILVKCMVYQENYNVVKDYAKQMKSSENIFYRHYGYYAEAYSVKKLSTSNIVLKTEANDLYNKAIAYYKNCTVSVPTDFIAYLYRARAYVDIGKYDKASEIGKLLPPDAQKTLQDYIDAERKR